ncbi:hypothetical protein [Escherichia coli]|uniref:hypothetical protein n=1 Tax=Escherichia coli TaxID=562 RepID=UPI00287A4AB6|nr:hypothetical protein [Escherichia coli]MDS1634223.1 hypothetical protein [Escherichia coli]
MKTNKKGTTWHIFYRENSGAEVLLEIPSFRECLSVSKELMTPSNYMICIEKNGERINAGTGKSSLALTNGLTAHLITSKY